MDRTQIVNCVNAIRAQSHAIHRMVFAATAELARKGNIASVASKVFKNLTAQHVSQDTMG